MKRRLLAALLTLFWACTGGTTPQQAAEGYLKALSHLDFDAASQFVVEDGRANLLTLRELYATLGVDERKKFQVADWKITGASENGNTATVDFVFDQVKKGQLSLQRVGGAWKVDSRKTF